MPNMPGRSNPRNRDPEVFANFGETAMHAQMFEVALANIVGFRDTLGAAEQGNLLDVHEAIRKYEAFAMGRQMEALKKEPGAIDAAVLRQIDAAIQVRNRLMHRFFPEHEKAGDFLSMEGMQRVVDDLAWIQAEMVTATHVCMGITQKTADNIRSLVERSEVRDGDV